MNLRKYISVIGCCTVLSASAVNDGYTNQDVWSAYEGFNKTFLDSKNTFTRPILPFQKQ